MSEDQEKTIEEIKDSFQGQADATDAEAREIYEEFRERFQNQLSSLLEYEPSKSVEEAIERVKSRDGRDVSWDTAMTLVAEIERLHSEIETLDVMSDPEEMAAIEQAEKDMAAGVKGMSLEELEKELGLEGDSFHQQIQNSPKITLRTMDGRTPLDADVTKGGVWVEFYAVPVGEVEK